MGFSFYLKFTNLRKLSLAFAFSAIPTQKKNPSYSILEDFPHWIGVLKKLEELYFVVPVELNLEDYASILPKNFNFEIHGDYASDRGDEPLYNIVEGRKKS